MGHLSRLNVLLSLAMMLRLMCSWSVLWWQEESGFPQLDCQGLERYLCVPELMKYMDAIFALLLPLLYFEAFEAAGTDCWCWGCVAVAK
ncbi:hypothetical protein Nepgr_024014 [Nepenthes gracilis]|uniref:Uncharacterized protein n=1 Tax=Nepenthes gracilis TaxID=150966 RepID=A0AAD3Y023_NEPGR|nr:hypothetical protein Nepgr_024014 [Nepenthes gracilis]